MSEAGMDYKLSDAVGLYSQQTAIENQLWTVYVVATFAAAGFGLSSTQPNHGIIAAVLIGFWAFTIGHLTLLHRTLRLIESIVADINSAVAKRDPELPYHTTLSRLKAHPFLPGLSAHLVIDGAVTFSMVQRIMQ